MNADALHNQGGIGRASWLAPVFVMAVATAVAAWASAPYLVGVFHDDGVYALLAQSIAAGKGFHYSNLVGEPAAIHYPPVYPLILAMFWKVAPDFPANVSILLRLNVLLVGIAAVGWWVFATNRLQWRSPTAACGALACSLALPTLALAGALLSETLFLAMMWPALMLCERLADSRAGQKPAGAGLAVGALMLVRTHALALLLAMLLVLAMRNRRRDFLLVMGAAVAVQLPWILWSFQATPRLPEPLEGAYGSYLGWFITGLHDGGISFVIATTALNARETWLFFQDRFAAGFPPGLHYAVLALALVAFATGVCSMWTTARVTVVFAAFYAAITLVWPYNPWRFIWTVWPLVGLAMLSGFRFIWVLGGRWRTAAVLTAAFPLAAMFRVELRSYAAREWRDAAKTGAAQITPALQWVRANTSPGDVLLGEGEQIFVLYGSRRVSPPSSFTAREYVWPPTVTESALRLSEMLKAVPARYVVLLNQQAIRAAHTLAVANGGLRFMALVANGAVFQVVR